METKLFQGRFARIVTVVTILERTDGLAWTRRERFLIVLATLDCYDWHSELAGILLLPETPAREVIEAAVGHKQFKLKVVYGLNNPTLPFQPKFV